MAYRSWVGLVLLLGACSFKVGGSNPDMSGGIDMAMPPDGGPPAGDDMAGASPDMGPVCTAAAKQCAGADLQTCRADGSGWDTTSSCALGCSETGGAHCELLHPTAPVSAGDLGRAGLTTPDFGGATWLVFDTSNGAITSADGTAIRHANGTGTGFQVVDGIAFRPASGGAVWTFASLDVPAAMTIVFRGTVPAAIASVGAMNVAGTIDVRGYADPATSAASLCVGNVAGPGGGVGGVVGTPAGGTGAGGGATTLAAGGGGGTYGGLGSAGGADAANLGAGTAATANNGTMTLNPLKGGSGGGQGGGGAAGGGGGGALQLVSLGDITITGVINAGGCGGDGGANFTGGAGGGAGGAILIESAGTVKLMGSGFVAANGGGGGGGGGMTANKGQPGVGSSAKATGGASVGNGGAGGDGGRAGSAGGTAADKAVAGSGAGGGGGGAGWIRINTKAGGVAVDGFISPRVSDGLASQGTVNIS